MNAIPPVKPDDLFPTLRVVGKVAIHVLGDCELFDKRLRNAIDQDRADPRKRLFSIPLIIDSSPRQPQCSLKHVIS